MLRILIRLLQLVAFLFILVFASKNNEVVALHFFFGWEWQAPLILLLLVFLVAGSLLGVLSCIPQLFSQRRELGKLRQCLTTTTATSAKHLPKELPPATLPSDHELS